MLAWQAGQIGTVWRYALDHDFAVVTVNARDFIELLDIAVHPGLIVLRESGLSRDEQWERIKPVIDYVQDSGDRDFLLNKLVEVTGVGNFHTRDMSVSQEAYASCTPVTRPPVRTPPAVCINDLCFCSKTFRSRP